MYGKQKNIKCTEDQKYQKYGKQKISNERQTKNIKIWQKKNVKYVVIQKKKIKLCCCYEMYFCFLAFWLILMTQYMANTNIANTI